MRLELLNIADKPSNVAVGAARTCYYPHGIVRPESCESWGAKAKLLSSVFEAGHHTTLQHTHLTFLISGMSRHLIWRLLHSHRHYNSEQVSQRYAKMKPDAFIYPEDGDQNAWQSYYAQLFAAYETLCERLTPKMQKILPKFKIKDAPKKAQEFARYLLPQGMSAYLYHTINVMTALRYIAAATAVPEAAKEALRFSSLLEEALLNLDASLEPLIRKAKETKASFGSFDMEGYIKKQGIGDENVKVCDILNCEPFELGMNYADVTRMSTIFHDGATLGVFNSYMKLSLAADAQNQRHRLSPAVRPSLESIYARDAYIPPVIAEDRELLELYEKTVELSYDFFESQAKEIGFGEAVYALPNAHLIKIVEQNDMASFIHKAQMRLCFNAQQEIFDLVKGQCEQLIAAGAMSQKHLQPPCGIRNDAKMFPICPEGDRFCGVKVWKLSFEKMERKI